MRWIILLATIFFNIGANIFLKGYSKASSLSIAGESLISYNIYLVLGVVLSGATLISYTITLRYFDLSIAYPTVTGLALIGVFVGSGILFKEEINFIKVIGFILIVIGVVLLSFYPSNPASQTR